MTEANTGHRRHAARWAVRLLLLLLALVVLVLAVQSVIAYSALRDARAAQQRLTRDITSTDFAAAQVHTEQLADATSRARKAVWGPWWALPEAVPWYGDDVRAVRLTIVTLDDVAKHVALPLVRSSTIIEGGLRNDDGTVDVAALDRLQGELSTASTRADAASNQLRSINTRGLATPLRPVIEQAQEDVARLAKAVQAAADGITLSRALVGAQHARLTLLGVQNPAESRGTGGIIGAWALLHGAAGRLELTSTGVNNQLVPYAPSPSDVPSDVLRTYGKDAVDIRNINMSPDFPVAARLLADDYRRYATAHRATALPDDALVLTVTPRALARLLQVSGPLRVAGYPTGIDADNAAAIFTNGIYAALPDEAHRTAFIRQVLGEVFARLQRPSSNPVELLHQIRQMVQDRDLMAWSGDSRVQGAITRLGMSGALPEPTGDTVVVSLVNSDASKLDYYLRTSISLRSSSATRGQLEITLKNVAPRTVAPYVGNHYVGNLPSTTHEVIVQIHLPPTLSVTSVLLDGRGAEVSSGSESGWTVVRRAVRLDRGASASLAMTLTGPVAHITTVVPPVMTSQVKVHIG